MARGAPKNTAETPTPSPEPTAEGLGLLDAAAAVCGWIYFFAWSLSFYPQCILNYRRKSVKGLSLDYVTWNVTGFFCYTLFTMLLNYSSQVRKSFVAYYGVEPPVELNDTVFAAHGLLLCVVTLIQCLVYDRGQQKFRAWVLIINGLIWCGLAAVGLLSATQSLDPRYLITYLGLGKVTASFVKYVPQVLLNFQRKSTAGWALHFVLLDMTGGIFSILQQLIRSFQMGSLKPFTSNIAKTGLAFETLLFDSIFLVQRFVLYGAPEDTEMYSQLDNMTYLESLPWSMEDGSEDGD